MGEKVISIFPLSHTLLYQAESILWILDPYSHLIYLIDTTKSTCPNIGLFYSVQLMHLSVFLFHVRLNTYFLTVWVNEWMKSWNLFFLQYSLEQRKTTASSRLGKPDSWILLDSSHSLISPIWLIIKSCIFHIFNISLIYTFLFSAIIVKLW